MCKEFPENETDLRRLSARMNKKLGNEFWPLGGTWDLEKCKRAEGQVWRQNVSQKWKDLITRWYTVASRLNERSRQTSWEVNAKNRKIPINDSDGKPRGWPVLKALCEIYDGQRRIDDHNVKLGDKRPAPDMTGLQTLFDPNEDTEEEEEQQVPSPAGAANPIPTVPSEPSAPPVPLTHDRPSPLCTPDFPFRDCQLWCRSSR